MLICSYCGGRVRRNNLIGAYVHTETAMRAPSSPGDWTRHYKGTRVGSYDIVRANVRDYMISAARAMSDDLSSLILPYSLPTRRGRWTIRQA